MDFLSLKSIFILTFLFLNSKQVKLLKSDSNSNSAQSAQLKAAKGNETLLTTGKAPAENDGKKTSFATVPPLGVATFLGGGAESSAAAEEEWSPEQQRQLETALKETKADDPERWDKIAQRVEGRTKKECIRRYKRLVEMVKKGKKAQPK